MEKTKEVFTAVFDENSIHWNKDFDHNRYFVQCQQNYFNHLLAARGHVFLNEINDALGFDRIPVGQVVGWLASEGNPIDFGLTWDKDRNKVTMVFNVDGIIYEDI